MRRQVSQLEASTMVLASSLESGCHRHKKSFCLVRIHGNKWLLALLCGPHWPITMSSPVCRRSLSYHAVSGAFNSEIMAFIPLWYLRVIDYKIKSYILFSFMAEKKFHCACIPHFLI